MKYYSIYKKALAIELIALGFELKEVKVNLKRKGFYKYNFIDSIELREALTKLTNKWIVQYIYEYVL